VSDLVVPAGHRLDVTIAWPEPALMARPGGALIAQLGLSSDAVDRELAAIAADLDTLLAKPRPRVLVANVGGALQELFAPANPTVMPVDGLLLWVLDADALAVTPEIAGRFMDLLRTHPIAQTVFVREAGSERARAMIAAIQTLEIGVRELEPPDQPIAIEVERPDGVILTALLGKPVPTLPPSGLPGGMASVGRAPRLRALLLASADASRKALYAELATRPIPLVAIAHPSGALRLRTWPNGFTALPVHADRSSLIATARELAMPEGSFAIVEMLPRALFAWASKEGCAVAIQFFDDAGEARYLAIEPSDVRVLGA